jgi:hypothetical protein
VLVQGEYHLHGDVAFAAQHFQPPSKGARSFRTFPGAVIPNAVRNPAGSEVSVLVICLGRFLAALGMTDCW